MWRDLARYSEVVAQHRTICFAWNRLFNLMFQTVSNKQFMGAVLVARDQTIVLDKGYGFANLEWNVPNSPTTKFRLGSITSNLHRPAFFSWKNEAS